jgi:hypothetical protein
LDFIRSALPSESRVKGLFKLLFVRNRQFFAALLTAAGNYAFAFVGFHAFAEPVLVFALGGGRLEGPFHRVESFVRFLIREGKSKKTNPIINIGPFKLFGESDLQHFAFSAPVQSPFFRVRHIGHQGV